MNYPFAALVGQEKLQRALLLCAINPGIGGVLIKGEKGTAKSTAARGLAEVVPPITKVVGCLFNCLPSQPSPICSTCLQPERLIEEVQIPFINLPLGASEDRVIGSLDLEGVLAERKKKLQPGLLAAAHRGILYIDEVNLLPDHLVDVLLDVAAMGVNTVQREGLSVSHPSRFTLIGTMNPEEGNLRPQLLDRFGLMVEVEAPREVAERTEVVRRRIVFESNPEAFANHWITNQQALQRRLAMARQLLPHVVLNDGLLTFISQLCTELGVTSLRADIVMYKTALTLAAFANRTEVLAEDVRQAAELVLTHRSRKKPFEETKLNEEKLDELMQQAPSPSATPPIQQPSSPAQSPDAKQTIRPEENAGQPPHSNESDPAEEQLFGVAPVLAVPTIEVETDKSTERTQTGRRSQTAYSQRGQSYRTVPDTNPTDLAVAASVHHAVVRQSDQFELTRDDLHQHIRSGKTGNLILFVVDASGSMAASRRMEAVKGAVLGLLTDAYQQRDRVGVIAFRGVEAQVLLEPTHSVEKAEQALRNLPTGGRTPLPHALQLACQLLTETDSKQAPQPLLVILSDGKANVPLSGGGDPWQQTIYQAAQLQQRHIPTLVLDTQNDYLRLGKAEELAKVLGAQYIPLEELSTEALTLKVNASLAVGK